jgi:hypothetical protein
VFLRLVVLMLAQALDLATFSVMVRDHGVAAEANPLVSELFDALGLPGVAIGKAFLVLLIGALCLAAAASTPNRTWRVVGGLPMALAIAIGIIGGITNTAVVLG